MHGQSDPLKAGDKGDVATMGGMVNVGNADVWGHAYTSPQAQSVLNGSVGSVAWHLAGKSRLNRSGGKTISTSVARREQTI
jgi:hypothetical protein